MWRGSVTASLQIDIFYPYQLLKKHTDLLMSAAPVSLYGLNTSNTLETEVCLAQFSLCIRISYLRAIWLTRFCQALRFKYSKIPGKHRLCPLTTACSQIIIFCYFLLLKMRTWKFMFAALVSLCGFITSNVLDPVIRLTWFHICHQNIAFYPHMLALAWF
jgi:hypothetical protein